MVCTNTPSMCLFHKGFYSQPKRVGLKCVNTAYDTCMCWCTYDCLEMPAVNVRYFPWSWSTLVSFCLCQSLQLISCTRLAVSSREFPLYLQSLGVISTPPCQAFDPKTGCLSVGPHTCETGTVPTELCPWPNTFFDLDFSQVTWLQIKTTWIIWAQWPMPLHLAFGRVEAGRSGIEDHPRLHMN